MERNNGWNEKLEQLKEKASIPDSAEKRFRIFQLGDEPYITLCNGGKRIEYAREQGKIILEYDAKKNEWNVFEKEWDELNWGPKKIGEEERDVLEKYWSVLQNGQYAIIVAQQ